MHLHPDRPGATFDTLNNDLIKGMRYPPSRLDRLLFKLTDFDAESMWMVGVEPIEGVVARIQTRRGFSEKKVSSTVVRFVLECSFRCYRVTIMELSRSFEENNKREKRKRRILCLRRNFEHKSEYNCSPRRFLRKRGLGGDG